MNIHELCNLPSFFYPALSWQKDRVAFFSNASGQIELMVLDISTGHMQQISHGQVSRTTLVPPVWTRDGKRIVTVHDKNGDEQYNICEFDIETKTRHDIVCSRGVNYPIEFSPDNTKLLFLSTRSGMVEICTVERMTGTVQRIADFSQMYIQATWSPDGKIWFSKHSPRNLRSHDIFCAKSDGKKVTKFWSSGTESCDLLSEFSPDGQFIGISSDIDGIKKAGILERKTKKVTWLTYGSHEANAPRFSPEGTHAVCLITCDGANRALILRKITPQSRVFTAIRYISDTGFPPNGHTTFVDFLDEETLLLALSTTTQRRRLITYNYAKERIKELVPAHYGRLSRYQFIQGLRCKFLSKDTTEIEGLLYRPFHAYGNTRVPALVSVHGGPRAQSYLSFNEYVQVICANGIAVLQVNYRGSTGYGTQFQNANFMDWGGGDLEDVVAGAEMLQKLPWVEPSKIGIFGTSFGGYLASMAILKHPQLWSAGITVSSFSDIPLLYQHALSHFKQFLDYSIGKPKKNKKKWKERSPITYVNNLQAPLLIIHSVHDARCPIEQARNFRQALLDCGKSEGKGGIFEYKEVSDAGHESFDQKQREDEMSSIIDFLRRRLLNKK